MNAVTPLDRFRQGPSRITVLGAAQVVGAAMVVALVMSTELLAQPFVWSNFPLDVIAETWAGVARNRLVVALCIAVSVIAVRFVALPSIYAAAVAMGGSIAVGAIAGEVALIQLGYEFSIGGYAAYLPRITRWVVISLVVTAMALIYGRATGARLSAQEERLRTARIERQAVESRLALLRAQIEPHFLFNTLATIRQLHRSEPESGALMLSNFIDYLKAAIPKTRTAVTSVRDELELVRAYLGLVQVRMSGRLSSSVTATPGLEDHSFPPLSLATLVENSIKHGIVPSEHGGHVSVTVRVDGDFVEASVVDNGVGLSDTGGGSGIGLANTRARLASLHGPTASLSLMHHVPHGVRAIIRIPFEGRATR